MKGPGYFVDLCKEAGMEFSIKNSERIEKAKEFVTNDVRAKPNKEKGGQIIDRNFTLKVHELLPEQPWKPGVHRQISKELKCTHNEYFTAVQMLIDEGLRNVQRDGVVYDSDGNIITFDPERVDPKTMELLNMEEGGRS
jgi:hypothetical protein